MARTKSGDNSGTPGHTEAMVVMLDIFVEAGRLRAIQLEFRMEKSTGSLLGKPKSARAAR
jgi:hypothetical protein